jgi:hypothetical protein
MASGDTGAAAIVAQVAAGLVVVGTAYNAGFFLKLGANYFVYLSYKDHLTTIMFLLTPLASSLFAIFATKSLICGQRNAKCKFDRTVLGLIIILVPVSLYVLSTPDAPEVVKPIASSLLYLVVFLSCGFFLLKVLESFAPATGVEPNYAQLMGYAFGLLIFIGAFGYFFCSSQLKSKRFDSEILVDKETRIANVHFVRTMEDGFFYIEQSDPARLTYRRMDSVEALATRHAL